MHITIGSDHAGFALKAHVTEYLKALGHEVADMGTDGPDSVDYPDFAHAVARVVVGTPGALGIVICGSGNGVNISANRHRGVRSALAWDPEIAKLAREHNDANVLALPARSLTKEEGVAIVQAFLSATFEGGRHQRRVDKIELQG